MDPSSYYLVGPNGCPMQIPLELMAAAGAAAMMMTNKQFQTQPPPPPGKQYADDFLRDLKRQKLEEEVEIKFLKDFTVETDDNGFDQLMNYITYDMQIIGALVNKNATELSQWVRNGTVEEVFKIVENIQEDIENIKKENFKFCKFNNICKYKECCAGIHETHMKSLLTCFSHVQNSANRLIERNTMYNASALMRNLTLLEINLWSLYSRRSYGKKSVCNY